MACDDYDQAYEAIANLSQAGGQAAVDAINCPYGDQVGMPIYASVVFGVVGLGILAHDGSRMGKVSMLLVLGMIAGPIYMGMVPAIVTQIVVFVLVLAIAAAFYMLYSNRGF